MGAAVMRTILAEDLLHLLFATLHTPQNLGSLPLPGRHDQTLTTLAEFQAAMKVRF